MSARRLELLEQAGRDDRGARCSEHSLPIGAHEREHVPRRSDRFVCDGRDVLEEKVGPRFPVAPTPDLTEQSIAHRANKLLVRAAAATIWLA
jgi:hypothetical protein